MQSESEEQLISTVAGKLRWILLTMMFVAFMDRTNISFVAAYMNKDIGLSASQFGIGASLFFVGYFLFEVPSNLIMVKVGARRWLARIMITWGLVSACSAFIAGPHTYYAGRFLLGVAEAGFIPGVMLYLSYWSPQRYLGKFTAWFLLIVPVSASITALITGVLLGLDQTLGLAGWRWAFLLEGIPAIFIGCLLLRYLAETPADARWLSNLQKTKLMALIAEGQREERGHPQGMMRDALRSPLVWVFGIAYFFLNIALGAQTWFPLAMHSFHLARSTEIIAIAVPSALASVTMMLWARRSDRRNERVWHVVVPSAVSAAAWFACARMVQDPIALLVLITVAYASMYAALVVFWTMPTRFLSPAARPAGLAIITALGLPGSMLSLSLGGHLRDTVGSFAPCFALAAGGQFLCGLIALALIFAPFNKSLRVIA
ncbi:MFS transporter [Burkholderia pseudomultivorans]|uniref:Major facilitator superfamily (MFS) profile domain-containing protein n=1 Tax=Burkholderia pseudomultivorans TaxID=1207504 RepID=A0A132EWF8_9BURK|nr:MFS transporter [Burkholderia pseudomultivorans]KWF60978.1 hypothetical protein WT57_02765 [Burkholderia pseudomultivorans]